MASETRLNDSTADQAVKTLQELGLTGSEAEVYVAALMRSSDKPISRYRLAREMGRDAANVGKVLDHLVRAGAMHLVQEKPRHFVPVDPATFTDRLVHRIERQGKTAVALLQNHRNPLPDGLTLALADDDQLLAKACELLASCQCEALVFGSRETLREIGAELEELGERLCGGVRVLSPTAMVAEHATIAAFASLPGLDDLLAREFLLMVVDNQAWLSGQPGHDSADLPVGWWGERSPIASILAGALTLAWQAQLEPQSPALPTAAPPAPETAAPQHNEPAPTTSNGLTFLMRHTTKPAEKKGEQ